jgi:glycosyltransferase involved in cell wall biosynthesis
LNIWIVQPGETLPLTDKIKKMRMGILAKELVFRGHSVCWWASAFDHFKKVWLFENDTEVALQPRLTIIAIKGRKYTKNVSLSRFIDHRIIAHKFHLRAVQMSRPDIIIAATPPYDLAYEAVRFATDRRIPIVVDIRDEWPDLFLKILPKMARLPVRLLLSREFWMIENALTKASGLIAMMDSLLEWGLAYARRERGPNDKVFYLGGTRKAFMDAAENRRTADHFGGSIPAHPKISFLGALSDKFIVVFVGTFVKNNDPTVLIECAKRLAGLPIHFVLAGDGDLFPQIKLLSRGLANMTLPGWLDEPEIDILLARSQVGVSPTSQIRDAFPNKVFSYIAAGLPLLSAFQGNLKDLLQAREFGFYFPPRDAEVLAVHVKKLFEDQDLYAKMSANARRIFEEMFDAEKIYSEYADYVEQTARLFDDHRSAGYISSR